MQKENNGIKSVENDDSKEDLNSNEDDNENEISIFDEYYD